MHASVKSHARWTEGGRRQFLRYVFKDFAWSSQMAFWFLKNIQNNDLHEIIFWWGNSITCAVCEYVAKIYLNKTKQNKTKHSTGHYWDRIIGPPTQALTNINSAQVPHVVLWTHAKVAWYNARSSILTSIGTTLSRTQSRWLHTGRWFGWAWCGKWRSFCFGRSCTWWRGR